MGGPTVRPDYWQTHYCLFTSVVIVYLFNKLEATGQIQLQALTSDLKHNNHTHINSTL